MTIIATTLLPVHPSACAGSTPKAGGTPARTGCTIVAAMPVIRLVGRAGNGTTTTRLLSRPDPPEG